MGGCIETMITVNSERIPYEEGMTVRRMLEICRYTFPLLVVKVNGELVPRDAYETFAVPDGSDVQAIHLISGG